MRELLKTTGTVCEEEAVTGGAGREDDMAGAEGSAGAILVSPAKPSCVCMQSSRVASQTECALWGSREADWSVSSKSWLEMARSCIRRSNRLF